MRSASRYGPSSRKNGGQYSKTTAPGFTPSVYSRRRQNSSISGPLPTSDMLNKSGSRAEPRRTSSHAPRRTPIPPPPPPAPPSPPAPRRPRPPPAGRGAPPFALSVGSTAGHTPGRAAQARPRPSPRGPPRSGRGTPPRTRRAPSDRYRGGDGRPP